MAKDIKLNFGIPTLADGWSRSKEYSNNECFSLVFGFHDRGAGR